MRRRRTTAFLSLAVLLTAFAAACSSKPEEPILRQFFRASRLNDSTSLAGFAVTKFNPQTAGTIASFTITNVSPEQRTPLNLSALAKQHEAARAEDAEFTKKKDTLFLDNTEAIARVLKAESAVVQLSLENPQNPVDITQHDGEMVTKDVTITAPVRLPNGTSADRTLVVTMQRAVLKANPEIAGKWIITAVKDAASS